MYIDVGADAINRGQVALEYNLRDELPDESKQGQMAHEGIRLNRRIRIRMKIDAVLRWMLQ